MKKLAIAAILLLVQFTAAAASVGYTYDSAGRLTKIDYGTQGAIVYTYDNAGNLLSRTVTIPPNDSKQKAKKTKDAKAAAPAVRKS
ncbi:MAG TPA: RHS repeat domain-containing protein [Bryobacteraceae bacterium]|jgi:hypothetical protein